MKHTVRSIFLHIVVIALAACGGSQPKSKEFSAAKCGLIVQLPSEPKEESRTANASGGPLAITLYTLTQGNSIYVVSCNDFPTDQVAAANKDRVLDNIGQGAMTNIGATLDNQTSVNLDGHPGRDIVGRATIGGQNAVVRARVYLVGNRMIQALVLGIKGQMSDADMQTYLTSLKLAK
jgi:hypothetical protein